jgi:peptidoglycan/LPS O-acetylase OafA/YrhL
MFLYLFYLGYLIPPTLEMLRARRLPENGYTLAGLVCLALAFLATSHIFVLTHHKDTIVIFFAAMGSSLLLLLLLFAPSAPEFVWLDHHAVRLMGRISYSFYLFDLVCQDVVERTTLFLFGQQACPVLLASALLFVATTALCAGVSWLSYTFVERPAVKLGSHF